jgi:hypothetical protein
MGFKYVGKGYIERVEIDMNVLLPVDPYAPERITPLKPSEAYRIGRMYAPKHIRGEWYSYDNDGVVIGACGMGAMLLGFGINPEKETSTINAPTELGDKHPLPCWHANALLPTQRSEYELLTVVMHLNDEHGPETSEPWNDNRIISWLESIES